MKRAIIKIDEEKCTGCGLCVPACVEGTLQIIDGKAKLVNEQHCDGLGACLGKCPTGALTVEVREAEEFDQETPGTQATTAQTGEHNCPSAHVMTFPMGNTKKEASAFNAFRIDSKLSHWPIQLSLVPSDAAFLQRADWVIAADCVGFAYPNFHSDFLQGRKLIICCPKLDDAKFYRRKLETMIKELEPRSLTVVNMEVPCCFGLHRIVEEALTTTGRSIPLKQEIISVKGKRNSSRPE